MIAVQYFPAYEELVNNKGGGHGCAGLASEQSRVRR